MDLELQDSARVPAEGSYFVGGMSASRILLTIGWAPLIGYIFFFLFSATPANPGPTVDPALVASIAIFSISTALAIGLIVALVGSKQYFFNSNSLRIVKSGTRDFIREIKYSEITGFRFGTERKIAGRAVSVPELVLSVAGEKKPIKIKPAPKTTLQNGGDVGYLIRQAWFSQVR
jgi:hypothetical protein